MTPTPTYLEFLAIAVLPVVGGLSILASRRSMAPRRWAGVALMVAVALAYTTPWDNYLVARGVWWYGEGTVLARVWHAPVGEYLFVVLQSVVAALWVYLLLDRAGAAVPVRLSDVGGRDRLVGVGAGVAVAALGVVLVVVGPRSTYYLGWILAWAGPVLALQWGFAWPYLAVRWRVVLVGVGVPTLYFWVVDRVALALGVWVISSSDTVGVALLGLPVEEAAFFLVTTVFVVQGLVLLEWVLVGVSDGVVDRLGASTAALRAAVDR